MTPAGRSSLGIHANSAAGRQINGLRGRPRDPAAQLDATRRRYRLQRIAQGLCRGERVAGCGRNLGAGSVVVARDADSGRAKFRGLETCGSVWLCPVCAAKITDRRRAELNDALAAWRRAGGAVYLLTFTIPHHAGLGVADALAAVQGAQRRVKARRDWKRAHADAGIVGTIRALEVTFGANGAHPHVHALAFARPGLLPDNWRELRDAGAYVESLGAFAPLADLWAGAVRAQGFGAVNEHGFDAAGGDYAADYVAKFGTEPAGESGGRWGPASELTRGHTKAGRRLSGAAPFALLEMVERGEVLAAFDRESGAMREVDPAAVFQEYARAFKGRRQLYWSPGLADRLGLGDQADDEAIAEDQAPGDTVVCQLDPHEWAVVIAHEARGDVLAAAEKGGAGAVAALVSELRSRRQTHSAAFADCTAHGRGFRSHYPARLGFQLAEGFRCR